MNAAAPPTYAYGIASLSQSIPALPALGNLDVNRAIMAGTPITPMNLTDAKIAAKKLRATVESPVNPGVTDEMVERAELRLRAVEDAHTAAVYAPGLMAGIAAILQRLETIDQRLDTMDGRLNTIAMETEINTAMNHNHRTIVQNTQSQPLYAGLRKTIPGDGLERAHALASRVERRSLNAPLVPVSIGEQPFTVAKDLSTYTNIDICRLIIFYNDDFGIVEEDDERARRIKLIRFLSHH